MALEWLINIRIYKADGTIDNTQSWTAYLYDNLDNSLDGTGVLVYNTTTQNYQYNFTSVIDIAKTYTVNIDFGASALVRYVSFGIGGVVASWSNGTGNNIGAYAIGGKFDFPWFTNDKTDKKEIDIEEIKQEICETIKKESPDIKPIIENINRIGKEMSSKMNVVEDYIKLQNQKEKEEEQKEKEEKAKENKRLKEIEKKEKANDDLILAKIYEIKTLELKQDRDIMKQIDLVIEKALKK